MEQTHKRTPKVQRYESQRSKVMAEISSKQHWELGNKDWDTTTAPDLKKPPVISEMPLLHRWGQKADRKTIQVERARNQGAQEGNRKKPQVTDYWFTHGRWKYMLIGADRDFNLKLRTGGKIHRLQNASCGKKKNKMRHIQIIPNNSQRK